MPEENKIEPFFTALKHLVHSRGTAKEKANLVAKFLSENPDAQSDWEEFIAWDEYNWNESKP